MDPSPLDRAATLGRFKLEKELGRGGHGVVFQAWDLSLSRHMAIKLVDPTSAGPIALARFQREGAAMGRLNPPRDRAHTERVLSIIASPDGARAVSCGLDGQVLLWDCRSAPRIVDRMDLTRAGDYGRAAAFVDAATLLVGMARGLVLRLRLP